MKGKGCRRERTALRKIGNPERVPHGCMHGKRIGLPAGCYRGNGIAKKRARCVGCGSVIVQGEEIVQVLATKGARERLRSFRGKRGPFCCDCNIVWLAASVVCLRLCMSFFAWMLQMALGMAMALGLKSVTFF